MEVLLHTLTYNSPYYGNLKRSTVVLNCMFILIRLHHKVIFVSLYASLDDVLHRYTNNIFNLSYEYQKVQIN